jgi:hypothetical protein
MVLKLCNKDVTFSKCILYFFFILLSGVLGTPTVTITTGTATPALNTAVTLTCTKAGSADIDNNGVKWYKDDTVINSETAETYVINSVAAGNYGGYKCTTTTIVDSAKSAEITLTTPVSNYY